MLKLFYKALFISFLSCSLMLMDFNSKGLMLQSAYAESVKTDAIKDKDLMGTLTMTVVGTLASRLYKYKMTTDIMLAAGGGAAFLGGEVLAFFKLKDVMKGMEVQITRDAQGNVDQEQIKSLERLKKSYEEAKKTAQMKKTIQMAAAAAFAAAGVMAMTMATGDMTLVTTCTTGVIAATTAVEAVDVICQGYASNYVTAAKAPPCFAEVKACSAAIKKYQSSVMTHELARQATGPSAAGLAKVQASGKALDAEMQAMSGICAQETKTAQGALSAACKPMVPGLAVTESGGTPVSAAPGGYRESIKNLPWYKENFNEKKFANIDGKQEATDYFSKALDFIFTPAKAELFSAMGIASSAAITYILETSSTLGPKIDFYMLSPQNRAIVWGILAGLTFAATSATDNVIKQIDANIEKIDKILNNLNSNALGATGSQVHDKFLADIAAARNANMQKINFANVKQEDVNLGSGTTGGANGEPVLPCYTGSDAAKCQSFDDAAKALPSYAGLNSTSQLQLADILKTTNGFNGTSKITGSTLSGTENLGGNAVAYKNALDKANKKYADALKKIGNKTDMDAKTRDLSSAIEKGVNDALKKSNSTAAGMLSSMYGGKGTAISAADQAALDAAAAKEKAAREAALKKSAATATGGVVNLNAGTSEKADLGLTGFEGSKSPADMNAEELAAYNAASKKAGNIDDYEIKNDITNDSSSSLFDLISHRYQQSGYPRLFKIKEQAPAAEPVKK